MMRHSSCVYSMTILSQFSPAIVLYDSRALNIMFDRRHSNTAENCVVSFDGDEYLYTKKKNGHISHNVFDFFKTRIHTNERCSRFFFSTTYVQNISAQSVSCLLPRA